MTERDPKSAHDEFTRCFEARDLDGLVALYEDEATFVGFDGTAVTGKAAIRDALEALLATAGPEGRLKLETRYAVRSGELALLSNAWQLSGTGGDGAPLDLSGQTTEIVRLQPDGSWLYVVDHPLGGQ